MDAAESSSHEVVWLPSKEEAWERTEVQIDVTTLGVRRADDGSTVDPETVLSCNARFEEDPVRVLI